MKPPRAVRGEGKSGAARGCGGLGPAADTFPGLRLGSAAPGRRWPRRPPPTPARQGGGGSPSRGHRPPPASSPVPCRAGWPARGGGGRGAAVPARRPSPFPEPRGRPRRGGGGDGPSRLPLRGRAGAGAVPCPAPPRPLPSRGARRSSSVPGPVPRDAPPPLTARRPAPGPGPRRTMVQRFSLRRQLSKVGPGGTGPAAGPGGRPRFCSRLAETQRALLAAGSGVLGRVLVLRGRLWCPTAGWSRRDRFGSSGTALAVWAWGGCGSLTGFLSGLNEGVCEKGARKGQPCR